MTKEKELEARIGELERNAEKANVTIDALKNIAKNITQFEKEHCSDETGFHAAAGIALSLVSSAILKEVIELRRINEG
ncbi:hypothetical protein KAR91_13710 [Candidatus Pacearchaeota archaeon]|nr:hypothetical protein [Candidatus Pacearchaeota archaeon]